MKIRITKEEYEALSDELQGAYKADGDEFTLDVEGLEDTGALKRAKDHEKAQRKAAQEEKKKLQEQLDALHKQMEDLKDEGSRKKGDIEALEASWQAKLDKQTKDSEATIERLTGILKDKTVETEAVRIATELSGENSALILPHIRSKLGFELTDEGAKVRVLGPDGKPTADSTDDLKNSYFTDPIFAPIVVGSKATGGGAAGSNKGGGAAKKKLSEMTATEEAVFANQNPEEYAKMREAEAVPR